MSWPCAFGGALESGCPGRRKVWGLLSWAWCERWKADEVDARACAAPFPVRARGRGALLSGALPGRLRPPRPVLSWPRAHVRRHQLTQTQRWKRAVLSRVRLPFSVSFHLLFCYLTCRAFRSLLPFLCRSVCAVVTPRAGYISPGAVVFVCGMRMARVSSFDGRGVSWASRCRSTSLWTCWRGSQRPRRFFLSLRALPSSFPTPFVSFIVTSHSSWRR
ncbi:hypothetical protein FB451DRAFT_472545 [Mycena latifolia]|nr:hypothetical protein FB451DRAFT_472545 [Mycena latifolia]